MHVPDLWKVWLVRLPLILIAATGDVVKISLIYILICIIISCTFKIAYHLIVPKRKGGGAER
jgi:hypothetical protein